MYGVIILLDSTELPVQEDAQVLDSRLVLSSENMAPHDSGQKGNYNYTSFVYFGIIS